MMPQIITEIIGVFEMFVMRIVFPLALTFGIGIWAERRFRLSAQVEEAARLAQAAFDKRSKIIPMQCWAIKHCNDLGCPAFRHPELPCWEATQVTKNRVREECLACRLYRPRRRIAA